MPPPDHRSPAGIARGDHRVESGSLLGLIGFAGGFFGPMILSPQSNQGSMLGPFFTGPAGLALGLLIGAAVGLVPQR